MPQMVNTHKQTTMENEGERKSMRSNLLEKRRLQLELASYEAAKRNVAIDMRKAQTEMRRRLQRYKARLKDISRHRDDSRIISIEEFLERHRRNKKTNVLSPRPHTSPLLRRMSKLIPSDSVALDNGEIALNPQLFGNRRKSKIDLRPATACPTLKPRSIDEHQRGDSICGNPQAQIRYFEEDEIQDRSSFYKYILELRKNCQQQITHDLEYRVADFCGKPIDSSLVISNDKNEMWRPLGAEVTGLRQQVKLFKPRIQLPLQPERSKTNACINDFASNKSLRIPSVVIQGVAEKVPLQRSIHRHNLRPATAAATLDVKSRRNNFLVPNEI